MRGEVSSSLDDQFHGGLNFQYALFSLRLSYKRALTVHVLYYKFYLFFSRIQIMKDWKAKHLITPADLVKYGKSSHIQNLYKMLERFSKTTPSKENLKKISK